MPTRFLIVDDSELVRQGLRTVLQANPQWEVCGEAAEGLTGVELFARREQLPPPDAEEFYYDDLVGLEAVTPEGVALGRVAAIVNHGAGEYARGAAHTNGIESVWAVLKRGLHGTYVSVEPFHLFRYLDEQTFRFNNRKLTDGERFSLAVHGIVGKRLTFDQLTGKTEAQA